MDTISTNKTYLLMQKIMILVIWVAITTCISCAFCAEGIYRKNLKEDKYYRDRMKAYEVASAKREALLDAEIRAEKARIQQSGQSFEARAMVFRMPPEPEAVLEPETQVGEALFVENSELVSEPEPEFKLEIEPEQVIEQKPEQVSEPELNLEPVSEPTYESTYEPERYTYYEPTAFDVGTGISVEEFLAINGITLEDLIIRFTCVVYPEAQGESYTGKNGVAATLFNWIRHQNAEPERGQDLEYLLSGYAQMSYDEYLRIKWHGDETEREMLADCEQAVWDAYAGVDTVEQLLGVKPFYFLLPEKSDPVNVYIMTQATYQKWVGNQLFCGLEGIDWTLKWKNN